jgi:hypothetical protein
MVRRSGFDRFAIIRHYYLKPRKNVRTFVMKQVKSFREPGKEE